MRKKAEKSMRSLLKSRQKYEAADDDDWDDEDLNDTNLYHHDADPIKVITIGTPKKFQKKEIDPKRRLPVIEEEVIASCNSMDSSVSEESNRNSSQLVMDQAQLENVLEGIEKYLTQEDAAHPRYRRRLLYIKEALETFRAPTIFEKVPQLFNLNALALEIEIAFFANRKMKIFQEHLLQKGRVDDEFKPTLRRFLEACELAAKHSVRTKHQLILNELQEAAKIVDRHMRRRLRKGGRPKSMKSHN